MECSVHSIERGKQRAGLSRNSFRKMSAQALRSGKGPCKYSSEEKKFLLAKTTNNSRAVVYNDYIFIFSEKDICITMYPIPSWFEKKGRYDGKNKVRNPKKYSRVRTIFDDLDFDSSISLFVQMI